MLPPGPVSAVQPGEEPLGTCLVTVAPESWENRSNIWKDIQGSPGLLLTGGER